MELPDVKKSCWFCANMSVDLEGRTRCEHLKHDLENGYAMQCHSERCGAFRPKEVD